MDIHINPDIFCFLGDQETPRDLYARYQAGEEMSAEELDILQLLQALSDVHEQDLAATDAALQEERAAREACGDYGKYTVVTRRKRGRPRTRPPKLTGEALKAKRLANLRNVNPPHGGVPTRQIVIRSAYYAIFADEAAKRGRHCPPAFILDEFLSASMGDTPTGAPNVATAGRNAQRLSELAKKMNTTPNELLNRLLDQCAQENQK